MPASFDHHFKVRLDGLVHFGGTREQPPIEGFLTEAIERLGVWIGIPEVADEKNGERVLLVEQHNGCPGLYHFRQVLELGQGRIFSGPSGTEFKASSEITLLGFDSSPR